MSESYVSQLPALVQQLQTVAPAEMLERFGEDADALGRVDFAARAAKVGDVAPGFTLPDQTGEQVSLRGALDQGPVVLTFYRGEWCPYCNLQLRTYQGALEEFGKRGVRLIAVSPQTPDHSLSMAEKNKLEFSVLSDAGNATARAYGLVYEIDEAMHETFLKVGTDLLAFNGGDRRSWELPATATYAIAPSGLIVFARVDGDYRNRTEPADVLDALE
jgi:peroxiredoxin